MGMYGRNGSDIIQIASVKDCERHGVMDELAKKPMYRTEAEVLSVLDTIEQGRYDVTKGIHEYLNTCIESYNNGTLS